MLENIATMYTRLVDQKTPATDEMFPILVYVLLFSNPEGLLSCVEYIRSHLKASLMSGESGYVLTSVTSAIQFLRNLDGLQLRQNKLALLS